MSETELEERGKLTEGTVAFPELAESEETGGPCSNFLFSRKWGSTDERMLEILFHKPKGGEPVLGLDIEEFGDPHRITKKGQKDEESSTGQTKKKMMEDYRHFEPDGKKRNLIGRAVADCDRTISYINKMDKADIVVDDEGYMEHPINFPDKSSVWKTYFFGGDTPMGKPGGVGKFQKTRLVRGMLLMENARRNPDGINIDPRRAGMRNLWYRIKGVNDRVRKHFASVTRRLDEKSLKKKENELKQEKERVQTITKRIKEEKDDTVKEALKDTLKQKELIIEKLESEIKISKGVGKKLSEKEVASKMIDSDDISAEMTTLNRFYEFPYSNLGIISDRKRDLKINPLFMPLRPNKMPHVIMFVEKETPYNAVDKFAKHFGIVANYTAGQRSRGATEILVKQLLSPTAVRRSMTFREIMDILPDKIKNKLNKPTKLTEREIEGILTEPITINNTKTTVRDIVRNNTIYVLGIVDYDKAGQSIYNTFLESLRKAGLFVQGKLVPWWKQFIEGKTPEEYTPKLFAVEGIAGTPGRKSIKDKDFTPTIDWLLKFGIPDDQFFSGLKDLGIKENIGLAKQDRFFNFEEGKPKNIRFRSAAEVAGFKATIKSKPELLNHIITHLKGIEADAVTANQIRTAVIDALETMPGGFWKQYNEFYLDRAIPGINELIGAYRQSLWEITKEGREARVLQQRIDGLMQHVSAWLDPYLDSLSQEVSEAIIDPNNRPKIDSTQVAEMMREVYARSTVLPNPFSFIMPIPIKQLGDKARSDFLKVFPLLSPIYVSMPIHQRIIAT